MQSMHTSSLHSSLKDESQDKDNTKLWKDEADPRTDVSPAVLDLQKKFALMSKELKKYRGEYLEIATIVSNIQQDEESQAENSSHHSSEAGRDLDEDTFSIMMTSKVCSRGWFLGLVTFGFQMTLVVIILIGYFKLSKDSTPFDAPIHVDRFVRVGQFFSVFLSVLSQDDLLTAIDSLAFFLSSSPEGGFYRLLIDENDDEVLQEQRHRTTWFFRAILPNCLKLIQGVSVLLCSLVVIVQSDVLIDLLKDFTALYFLSEIDNIVYRVASQGYFGQNLRMRTERVKNVTLEEESDEEGLHRNASPFVERFRRNLKIPILCALIASMFGYLIYVVDSQISGDFVIRKYPNCTFTNKTGPLKIADDHCDGFFNKFECGFDGNDCEVFNLKYSNCPINDTDHVGDGFCNGGVYNTIGCLHDGGDCEHCPDVPRSDKDTRAIVTGDFNDDNFTDIVVGNCGLSNQMLLNNGDGTFRNATDLPGGNNDQCTTSIAVADLDGDGFDDIIIGRQKSNLYRGYTSNLILWNNRDGTFTKNVLRGSSMVDTRAIEVADLNNDSFPAIIVGNSKGYSNTIFWNQKNANQNNRTFYEEAMSKSEVYDTRSISVDLEDVSTNLIAFVFFGNYDENNANMLYGKVASDSEDFGEPYLFDGTSGKKTISIANFTTTWVDASNNEKREKNYVVFLNEGGYHEALKVPFSNYNMHALDDEAIIKARSIAVVDMNNESGNEQGLAELVTGHGDGESNRVFFLSLETTSGPFLNSSIELPCTKAMNTTVIALADLDNDGHMDIIMGNYKQKNQVLLNFVGDSKTYKQPGNDTGRIWLPENSKATKYPECKVLDLARIGDKHCDGYPFNTDACGCDGGDCFCKHLFDKKYPDCNAQYPAWIGNGACNNVKPYNTAACKYDGGDCKEFNEAYPGCEAEELNWIGDGECYNFDQYNTAACKYDGGDCKEFNEEYPGCNARYPNLIGDGECHNLELYNTAACKYDGGDCKKFNDEYPDCKANKLHLIGDGNCHNFEHYNTPACKYDGGDCNKFNLNANYTGCKAKYPKRLGDGTCHNFESYNTAACNYDGRDCDDFNANYTGCEARDPSILGNGKCNNYDPYKTAACKYDGGDCKEFNKDYPGCEVRYPSKLKDGKCDGGVYNTKICKYDGGDCIQFNAMYPACKAADPYLLGNGECDNVHPYNTEACGYDGGDCEY